MELTQTAQQLTSAAVSDRGLSEKRPQNEDSYLEMPDVGIFAVADGVGGAQAGEVASQMAVEILAEAFTNRAVNSDPEMVMKVALEKANSAIYQMSNDVSQLAKMATTIVAVYIDNDVATIAHVGDSRVYRIEPTGTIRRETEDHSMVADEVRAGRMTQEQAENHPGKNIINRALGAETDVDIDLKTIMIAPGTTFLLCSDGITRHIPDSELQAIINAHEDLSAACARLKEVCYERGAEDNLTAVLARTPAAAFETAPEPIKRAAETDILALPDEEDTLISARFHSANGSDDNLLELEDDVVDGYHEDAPTELPISEVEATDPEQTVPAAVDATQSAEPETAPPPMAAPSSVAEAEAAASQPAPMYNNEMFSQAGSEPSSGVFGKAVGFTALFILGTLVGIAIYHFAFRPSTEIAAPEPLTEMQSPNIPFTSFEGLRREIDRDPALYVAKHTAPEDAEDHYLLGRAYLLTGDSVKARAEFTEARKLLPNSDQVNQKSLENDIAIGMAVTSDTTIQRLLKKELETSVPSAANAATPNR
ncbi:MAG: Stp1/IreP family PP2C-type Ser/Thr phosphatase [Acidobacteria bacterium]|nr:Stp1/IreP family PP2C-type Ser/Thr phosphatase [Acidobacteriota bacterium]